MKFQGIIFDNKLSFKSHIEYLRRKCQKAMNLLKVLCHTDLGADREILLILYKACIKSRLDYGSIVYGSACKSYLHRLGPVQNQGLRLCLGAFRTSPQKSLEIEAQIPPLELRREKLSLQYAIKAKVNQRNPAHRTIFRNNNQNCLRANRRLQSHMLLRLRVPWKKVLFM